MPTLFTFDSVLGRLCSQEIRASVSPHTEVLHFRVLSQTTNCASSALPQRVVGVAQLQDKKHDRQCVIISKSAKIRNTVEERVPQSVIGGR